MHRSSAPRSVRAAGRDGVVRAADRWVGFQGFLVVIWWVTGAPFVWPTFLISGYALKIELADARSVAE